MKRKYPEPLKTPKDWSDDGQVYFCDGNGYALTKTLKTICIGKKEDLLRDIITSERRVF